MKKLFRMEIALVLVFGFSPSVYAAEYSHTALVSFCPHQNTVVGSCISSHSGGIANAINFRCLLKRGGLTLDAAEFSAFDLETSTEFGATLTGPLTANRNYCARNKSDYLNAVFGGLAIIANQGSSGQHCNFYSVSGTGR